jgi:hypothetical protein
MVLRHYRGFAEVMLITPWLHVDPYSQQHATPCCDGVTVVLRWCHSGVTMAFQWCYSWVHAVLHLRYRCGVSYFTVVLL